MSFRPPSQTADENNGCDYAYVAGVVIWWLIKGMHTMQTRGDAWDNVTA